MIPRAYTPSEVEEQNASDYSEGQLRSISTDIAELAIREDFDVPAPTLEILLSMGLC